MGSRLIDSLATTDALAEVFADSAILASMLAIEVNLAQVEAALGIIPVSAAEAVARAAVADAFDVEALAREARQSGTVVVPLVTRLVERVRALDPAAAGFVHYGATSQDVADTALSLALVRAHAAIAADHRRLTRALRLLSDRHAATVMAGRTLLQQAAPITFGLKAAGWLGAVSRGWTAVTTAAQDALVVQFGGGVGTMAALDAQGPAVAGALADALQLGVPAAPWHTHRDRLALLVAAHGVYIASLGKIARDVSLLMQSEVGEASEIGGSSSTMPQKRNPSGCAIALAAATRGPGLVASYLAGMVQEHERSVGGWHAEWPTVSALVQASGSAAAAMADAVEGLSVDTERMRQHLGDTGGAIMAEAVLMRLSPALGRDVAHRIVGAAVRLSQQDGRHLVEVLASMPDVVHVISADDLLSTMRPDAYLGAAEMLRLRLLADPDSADVE